VIHRHIYFDADNLFAEKISVFHDFFVESFLITGVDKETAPLDEIKMTKNPSFSMLYYKRIVGGVMATKSLLTIQSFLKSKLHTSCNIYYLNNNNDIDDFFLYQKVRNWNGSNKTCHQLWKMEYVSLKDMHEFWLENEEMQ
tara:strand:- start:25 stop:447 length:423 start_codon:yes stop_codon:yes gene_type:complete